MTNLARASCFVFLALMISVLLAVEALGQAAARPDRGVMPTGSYSVSDVENVSLTNGNMNLSMPLAGLPAIAGGKLSWALRAEYNSKLWDTVRRELQSDQLDPATKYVKSNLQLSDAGGWRVGALYSIRFEDITSDYNWLLPPPNDPEYNLLTQNRWSKVDLTTPDGATHELRPKDYFSYADSFGRHNYLRGYYGDNPNSVNGPVRYYSFDGSHLWARIDPDQYLFGGPARSWKLYLPDGTKVEQLTSGDQRVTDSNGNKVKIFTTETAGVSTQHYQDEQTGREIKYVYDPAGNNSMGLGQVQYQTVGGTWVTIDVNFGLTRVYGKRYEFGDPVCADAVDYVDTQITVIRSIVYPQTEPGLAGRQFTFAYNSDPTDTVSFQWRPDCAGYQTVTAASHGWGSLSQIVMPTGAMVNYVYGLDGVHYLPFNPDDAPREGLGLKTLTHDGTTDSWQYSRNPGAAGFTSPDGSSITETRYPSDPGYAHTNSGFGGKEELVYRTNSSNKVMVERHWTLMNFGGDNVASGAGVLVSFNPVVDAEYTSLLDDTPNHNPVKMSAKTFQYDYNGNLITETDYDWFPDLSQVQRDAQGVPTGVPGGATVLRVSNSSYYNGATSASSGNVYAKRSLSTATPLILNALQQTTVGASITQLSYDGQAYGTAPTAGNLTSQSVWDNLDNKWITSSLAYGAYGNLVTKTDPRGKVTQLYYDDATHAAPNRVVVDPENGTGQQTTTTTFDYYTGLVTSQTDANGNTSTIDYTNQLLGTIDPFGRPGVAIGPLVNAGGVNQHHRTRTFYEDHSLSVTARSDLNSEGDGLLKSRTTSDMLGRVVLNEQSEDGTNYTIYARKAYNEMGKITYASSPMRYNTASSTDAWTRVTNDNAGRVVEVSTFRGVSQPPASGANGSWTGSVMTAYDANFTTVTDQASKSRRSMVDGLGRLTRVDEPDAGNSLGSTSAPAQPTSYSYDVFGNLRTVVQGSQTRTFIYDSLSRLRSANNPESGTIAYSYDDNGNLTQKTDARPVTTAYTYDALNRNTSVTHSDGTPWCGRAYDGAVNGKGRFWYHWTSASDTARNSHTAIDAYDALGQVKNRRQHFWVNGNWSAAYSMSRNYDLAGHVTSQAYPSGRTVNYGYDAAGRLNNFTGHLGDGVARNYATGAIYDAAGRSKQEQFGTDTPVYNKLFYNSWGQLAEIRESTTANDTSWNRGAIINHYSNQSGCWGASCNATDNNGNLMRQEVYIPANDQVTSWTTWWQRYEYDNLNRLRRVHEYTGDTQKDWQQEYVYDRWGNRSLNSGATWGNGINSMQAAVVPNTTTNRLYAPGETEQNHPLINYDAAGNQIKDYYSVPGVNFDRVYDADNRMTSATDSGNHTSSYGYNASDQRVTRIVNGLETWQIYGIDGELVAEYPANAAASSPQKEYGYRNGQLLITAESAESPSGGTQNVSWTNIVGVSASGNSLTKTAATGWGNAGAASTQTINSGDGYVEFTASETNTDRICGLSHGDANQDWTDLDFGLYMRGDGMASIVEAGTYYGSVAVAYSTGDHLRVAVEGGVVKYKKNGTVFYTSTVAPTYPLLVDTALYTSNSTIANVVISSGSGGGGTQNASWANAAGASVSTNNLAKTAGNGWGNAGAASTQTINSGDGYVEFTASETNTDRICGLSHGDTNQDWTDLDFGLYMRGDGMASIVEAGTYYGSVAVAYSTGDHLRVAVEGGVVKYKKNGTVFYTSNVSPAYPLLVDTALYTSSSTIAKVVISSGSGSGGTQNASWANAAGASVSTNNLTKTATIGWGNAGAASTQTINSGDGYVEFTASETNTDRICGLSHGDTNQDWTDLDFGLYMRGDGMASIVEAGTYYGSVAVAYSTGDHLRVAVEGGVVKYKKNGTVFYTSNVSPAYPLLVDTALYTSSSTIANVVISSGSGSGGTQNASWTNAAGASVSTNNLTKTAGNGWGNAGAASTQTINSGDGYVEFTASETNTDRICGLSRGDSSQDWTDLDFGLYMRGDGMASIVEAGTYYGSVAVAYSTGDHLRVEVEGGVVKYKKNGTVFYTSNVSPAYPLLVDTALYTSSSTITNVVISSATGGGGGGANIHWLVADQLGTPRMIFDQSGALANVSRHDYLPFGEELYAGTGGRTTGLGYTNSDGARQKFTQKERDIETGLDYFGARYYASVQGRFTGADPYDINLERQGTAGREEADTLFKKYIAQPQHWNHYSYALNNPLRYVDPDGMKDEVVEVRFLDKEKFEIRVSDKFSKAERDVIIKKITAAIDKINAGAANLTEPERKSINSMTGIRVTDDIPFSYTHPTTRIFNMKSQLARTDDVDWLAGSIVHDSRHADQFRNGKSYDEKTQDPMESDANDFAANVGEKIGLNPQVVKTFRQAAKNPEYFYPPGADLNKRRPQKKKAP